MLTFVACCPVVGIDLHARLCGIHIKRATALGVSQTCGKRQLAFFLLVQNEAMVVAGTVLDLLIVGINVLANSLFRAEVERSACHFQNLSSRDGSLVDGDKEISIDQQFLVVDGRGGVGNALKREESMVGEVDDGLLVGLIVNDLFLIVRWASFDVQMV